VSEAANPVRGEAAFMAAGCELRVRPSFAALVAAEGEVGPLLALAERAAQGHLALGEMEALLWHCCAERPEGLARARIGEALVAQGIGAAMPAVRMILRQILLGGQ